LKGGIVKTRRADYSHYEIPELEETEFVFSACPRFEDANDGGHIGDSISFAMDVGDEISMFDA
jgi:hypothetical protein